MNRCFFFVLLFTRIHNHRCERFACAHARDLAFYPANVANRAYVITMAGSEEVFFRRYRARSVAAARACACVILARRGVCACVRVRRGHGPNSWSFRSIGFRELSLSRARARARTTPMYVRRNFAISPRAHPTRHYRRRRCVYYITKRRRDEVYPTHTNKARVTVTV